jgi:hypothetical protein
MKSFGVHGHLLLQCFEQHNCNEHDFGQTYCNQFPWIFFQHITLNELEILYVPLTKIGK